jgi:predicted nucleotidyltransferase component of viral defense system
MIDKREILDTATALGLNPHVVEKDYVLGWLLWGIYGHKALSESWIFKGGTCLKKCFFETYRFSEDLDFTLTDPAHVDTAFLAETFAAIGERVYETTGIELPPDVQKFEIYENPRGQLSCQGRIGYRGPVSPRGKNLPRVKFDLTADERVVLPPISAPVFHPYSDLPDDGFTVRSYAYEEAFAEKVRALAERTRPRDLYDVINLFRNAEARPPAAVLLDVLRQKCEFKGIAVPVLATLAPHRPDLEGGWGTMLAHQLPALPPVEAFWDALAGFFAWLEGGAAPEQPAAYTSAAGEELIQERTLRLPVGGAVQSYLEIIRFAASNRLCVALEYTDERGRRGIRVIEPYSLRRTRDGNIILHAHNVDRGEHRSYRVDRIEGAQVTNKSFVPRFAVELSPKGIIQIPPPTTREAPVRPSRFAFGRPTQARKPRAPRTLSSSRFGGGPSYVYECGFCGKRFSRKSQTASLNPHKDKSGWPCPGRHAFFVDTRY